MNPLYNMQNGGLTPELQQGINYAKNLMKQLGSSQDPTQLLNDPRIKEVMNLCRGSTPEQFTRFLCKQAGIDPDSLIRELQK